MCWVTIINSNDKEHLVKDTGGQNLHKCVVEYCLSYLERDQTRLLLAIGLISSSDCRYARVDILAYLQSELEYNLELDESRKLSLGKIKLDQVCASS